MVKIRSDQPAMRSVYYYKPGQTAENTKVSERALALLIPENEYKRFCDFATESEKVKVLAMREAKKLADLKAATYEMSKTWQDTAQNIQRRRKEELLSRKKIEEAERIKFTKEMAVKNALERAEVVKQAKELILYQRPHVRLINRALVVSECLRQLDEQAEAQKTMANLNREEEEKYAKHILEDVRKFQEEEKVKQEERFKKLQKYRRELQKQIEMNRNSVKNKEKAEREAEIEDLKYMIKEINDINENELKMQVEKRESLKKMFLGAIEEKRKYELKVQQDQEFQDKTLKIYTDWKREMEKTSKEKLRIAKEEKIKRLNNIAKRFAKQAKEKSLEGMKNDKAKEEIDRGIEEQRKMDDLKRIEEQKQKKEKARLAMEEQLKNLQEEAEKRRKETTDMLNWETLQRYKRDEFNKEWNTKHLEDERNKKLAYGKLLKKQMAIKTSIIKDNSAAKMQEMIDRNNEKVLAYGEKILRESEGVRPVYPIAKVIGEFKREVGLIPPNAPKDTEAPAIIRKKRRRQQVCSKPISEENAFYFA